MINFLANLDLYSFIDMRFDSPASVSLSLLTVTATSTAIATTTTAIAATTFPTLGTSIAKSVGQACADSYKEGKGDTER